MQLKKKICNECNRLDYIFSKGRCKSCAYKSYFKKSKTKKVKNNLSSWFNVQKSQIPNFCEECGESLEMLVNSSYWTTTIAHIVPKRANKYPSVATHPLNRMFYCDHCHNRFDNLGLSEIESFKSLPVIKKRFLKIYESMTDEEQNKAEIEYNFFNE